jgi:hypothetical protein
MNLKRLAPILLISISLSFVMPIANAGTGTLSGITYAVGGVTPRANVPVVAYNLATGEVMWDDIVLSATNGAWAMALQTGTYAIIAKTPDQDILNTDSDMYPTVTVDGNGGITLSGDAATSRTPTTFNLTLKAPRWTGTIKSPAGTLMEWAHICITDSVQSYRSCSYSDSLGQWALGAPSNVTTYDVGAWVQYLTTEGSPTQWPERRFDDKTEIEAVGAFGLFPAAGATKTGIQLAFAYPNFTVVVKAGGTVVANAWAQLFHGNNWIGWQRTDQNGYAGWTDADLTETSTVSVQVGNTTVSQTYAATSKTFTKAEVEDNAAANAGVFTADIALDSPNLFGVLRQPTVAGTPGAVVSYGNIELRAVGDYGAPLSFENTDSLGLFSLNIPKPTAGADLAYTMTVGPTWNSLLSSSRTMYDVTVSTANAVTVKLSGTTITATNTAIAPYALALSAPSVSGIVVGSNGTTPQADSYVMPIDHATGELLWEKVDNSKSNGNFGISLADGIYDLQALKPWNRSDLSNSALCAITVAGGVVTTVAAANTCVPTTNTLKLALRTPNLTMTLKDSAGAAVAFARVGLQVGNWYTDEISGSDGTIGLNIDRAEIIRINGAMPDTTTVNVYVDPPWGTSTVVGWRCQSGDNKAVCKTSSAANDGGIGDFKVNLPNQTFALGNVVFGVPNTTIHIRTPNVNPPAGATWESNTAVAGAWVWLNVSGNETATAIGWIGANSDANGDVKFDIDSGVRADASTRFRVEIYPPWNGAVGLSQKTYNSQVLAAIEAGGGLALNSPNTFITVNVPAATPTIWGWIGVEEVNATTNASVGWQGGYGLNQLGKVALTLSASKRYKITAYPNKTGAGFGTVTSCYINTDASATPVVSKVSDALCEGVSGAISANTFTLTLSAGNVTGTVTRATGGTPVVNATVYATDSPTVTTVVSTTTSATGTFALNLNSALTWVIKILPYNVTGATPLVAVTTVDPFVFVSNAKALGTLTVANAP